jgi:hypothetical protein
VKDCFEFLLAFSEYLNFKKYQIWKMHNQNVLRQYPQRLHKEFDLILRPLKLCCQEVNALYSPLVAVSVIGFQVLIMFLIPAYWNRGYTTLLGSCAVPYVALARFFIRLLNIIWNLSMQAFFTDLLKKKQGILNGKMKETLFRL